MRGPRTFAAATVGLLASACQTLEPTVIDPADAGAPVAPAWSTPAPAGAVAPGWVERLGDPRLPGLVAEAVANSFELRASAARVDLALAQAMLAAADARPSVDGSAAGSRRGSGGPTGRVVADDLEIRLDAAWEPDVWGRLADATRAAALDARASAADLEAARLSLAANVAQAWFDAAEAALQVELADDTAQSFAENLAVVEDGYRAGLNTALDVQLERANLASARGRLEARRVDRDRAVRTLEVLLGRYPGGALEAARRLPPIEGPIPAGLPSALLERRPDVRAAALRIEASAERIDEARKARLPRVRLTAAGGVASPELRRLLDFDSLLWSIAGSLLAPVLDAGRIEARIDVERARADEALARYAQTALQAFREVEDALAAERHLARQQEALEDAATRAEDAAALALERYRAGLVDLVTWLEARRRAFEARSALLSVVNRRLQNRIALHLALGGDFGAAPGEAGAASPGRVAATDAAIGGTR